MVRHKTVSITKELGDTVKTCLLYLAMSQSNQTYIIEINPFTKEKIYHTYRMTQPNRFHFFDDTLEGEPCHLSLTSRRRLYGSIQQALAIPGLDEIVSHCHAGYSRSRAVGSFITKYLLKDEAQFEALKTENGGFAGNPHVLGTLIKIHQEEKGEK